MSGMRAEPSLGSVPASRTLCTEMDPSHAMANARYLNVSKNTVSDWERGVKKPGGPALRLLSLMKTHGVGIFATA